MTQKPPPRLLRRKSGGFFVKCGARRRSFGTCPAEAHASYERFRIEWDQAGGRWPLDRAVAPSVSILVAEVWPWIEARTAAPSLSGWRSAARTLIEMNGPTDAECFGLPELEAIRQRLIDIGLGSSTVTQRVRQIKTLFRRGAAVGLIDAGIPAQLEMLPRLSHRDRRSDGGRIKPPRKILPVSDEVVAATLPHLPIPIQALVQLQRLVGCRGSELLDLRPVDLDMSNPDVWIARRKEHKTSHSGAPDRVLAFGPRAIAILEPFLDRPTTSPLFSPKESQAASHARRGGCGRRPSQRANPTKTGRSLGETYTANSYRRAIAAGCKKAGVEQWSPHQLRHARITEAASQASREVAQTLAGHASPTMTDHYTAPDMSAYIDLQRRTG